VVLHRHQVHQQRRGGAVDAPAYLVEGRLVGDVAVVPAGGLLVHGVVVHELLEAERVVDLATAVHLGGERVDGDGPVALAP